MIEGDTIRRIRKAVADGRLKQPFHAAGVDSTINIDFAGTFLPKHRVGNPSGSSELSIQIERGLYRLK